MTSALIIVPAVVVALFALERWFPLRRAKAALADRLTVNVALGALAIGTALLTVRPVSMGAWEVVNDRSVGLLMMAPLPEWLQGAIAFLLFDLTFYYWHRANHSLPLLWRLHVVHHIDPDLDVTTAFRFHFVEIALSAGFRGLQILLIGGPAWAAIAYEVAFQVNSAFQHSNVRVPLRIERWINLVTVTPRMHGIHHSKVRRETNSNWSSVFSFWDRLHRTLELDAQQRDIDIGIAGYANPEDNRLWRAVVIPFEPQRPYWREEDRGPLALGRERREGARHLQP